MILKVFKLIIPYQILRRQASTHAVLSTLEYFVSLVSVDESE